MVTRSRLSRNGAKKRVSRLKRTPVKMEIFYSSYFENERNPFMIDSAEPTELGFKAHYKKLPVELDFDNSKSVKENLELVFAKMNIQGQNPMTTAENQNWVRANHVHTSMSVGDVIKIGNDYYMAKPSGYRKLKFYKNVY